MLKSLELCRILAQAEVRQNFNRKWTIDGKGFHELENLEYWNEVERFYLERFVNSSIKYKGANFEFIPFGIARRMCPGILYGIANVELPFAKFLYHLTGNFQVEESWKILTWMRFLVQ
ncbi:hypothetical protein REPUB_Repub09cG0059300 [Reevesia pubescens]